MHGWWLDGWMHGWWLAGWLDEQTERWMDLQEYEWMGGVWRGGWGVGDGWWADEGRLFHRAPFGKCFFCFSHFLRTRLWLETTGAGC